MTMTSAQSAVTILAVVLGTMLTRFLPFFLFPEGKEPPPYILHLGRVLPCAVTGLLVVYCLKDAVFTSWHGLPEGIAMAVVAALHEVEREHAAQHGRRHGAVYGSGADLLLKTGRGFSAVRNACLTRRPASAAFRTAPRRNETPARRPE